MALSEAERRLGDATIRSLLGVREGDLYRENELLDAQRSLYQADLFRHVDVARRDRDLLVGDGTRPSASEHDPQFLSRLDRKKQH